MDFAGQMLMMASNSTSMERVEAYDPDENVMIASSILAAIGSLLVLMTGAVFYKEMVENRLFMKMILMVSLMDFIGDIALSWGFPRSSSVCEAQGFLVFFFYRAGWLWCALISISLYLQVSLGRKLLSFQAMNFIIWPLNIGFQFLPLVAGIWYGNCAKSHFGSLSHPGNISIKSYRRWVIFTLFLPLFCSMIIMGVTSILLLFRDLPRLRAINTDASNRAAKALGNASMYPILMVCAFLPLMCIYVYIHVETYVSENENTIHESAHDSSASTQKKHALQMSWNWSTLYGFGMAIGFFYKSREARRLWGKLLLKWSRYIFGSHAADNGLDDSGLLDDNSSDDILAAGGLDLKPETTGLWGKSTDGKLIDLHRFEPDFYTDSYHDDLLRESFMSDYNSSQYSSYRDSNASGMGRNRLESTQSSVQGLSREGSFASEQEYSSEGGSSGKSGGERDRSTTGDAYLETIADDDTQTHL